MYQSILSLTTPSPRAIPGDLHVFSAREGGRGLELEKFSTFLKKNAGNFRFVLKKPEAA